MALTITYDWYWVVANADALSDTGWSWTGTWRELGWGSFSVTPDAKHYGTVSIGSKYAAKSWYTYIDWITPLDFSPWGAQEWEMLYIWVKILSNWPLQTLANNWLSLLVGSSTANSTEYRIAWSDDANEWGVDWRLFVVDPTIVTWAISNWTIDLSAINTIWIWIDTADSVRAETFFQSQIMCAKWLKVEWTSTTMFDDIVAWCTDYTNRAAWMFQKRWQTYYSVWWLSIHSDTANTVISQAGANVEYEKSEFWNWTAWTTTYPTDANIITAADTWWNTTSVDFSNCWLSWNDSNMLSLAPSTATAFDVTGWYLKYLGSALYWWLENIDTVVISLSNAIKPNGATFTAVSIWETLETITWALELVNSTDLNNISDIKFTDYTWKYALYIPASITGSITIDNFVWDSSWTDIYWAWTSWTLVVNNINGSNFTTWASWWGTVDIQTSVSYTLKGLPNGIEVRFKQWSHTLQHTQDVTGNEVVYAYNYTWDEPIKISFVWAWIIQSKTLLRTLTNLSVTEYVDFELDPSYIS